MSELEQRRFSIRSLWYAIRPYTRWGRRWLLTRQLQNGLLVALTGLSRIARSKYVPMLAQVCVDMDPDLDDLFRQPKHLQHASFAMLLMRWIDLALAHNAEIEAQFASLYRQSEFVIDDEAHQALLVQYLQSQSTGRWSLWQDKRALARRMDLDALRERSDERRFRNFAMMEIALRGIVHFWQVALHDDQADPQEVRDLALHARPLQAIAQLLPKFERWTTRALVADILVLMLQEPDMGTLPPDQLDYIRSVIEDADEHPWVRRACLRAIFGLDKPLGLDLALKHLETSPRDSKLQFLFRSLILVDFCTRYPITTKTCERLLTHWAQDPSEHVRIRFAEHMVMLPVSADRILAAIEAQVCGPRCDPSQKVRARTLLSLKELLQTRIERNRSPHQAVELLEGARILSWVLQRESESWVLEIACTCIQDLAQSIQSSEDPQRYQPLAQSWIAVLSQIRSDGARPMSLVESASAALEALSIALDAAAARICVALERVAHSIRAGSSRRVVAALNQEPAAHRWLGRLLAQITRNDWGLYLQKGPRRPRLQRAALWRIRAWRVLHELSTPSPNKRKGFAHSKARFYRGRLRAHPGGLDEATATVVPGERISIKGERGWGRHLPLVDDLLGRPWPCPKQPIEIYSSLGCTKLWMRGSWTKRLLARLRVTLRYASLAQQRQASLQSDDPHERGKYAKTLAERYGVHMEFALHPLPGQPKLGRPHPKIASLFNQTQPLPEKVSPPSHMPAKAAALAPWLLVPREWLSENAPYLLSNEGNDQHSLSLFLTGLLCLVLFDGYRRRRRIRIARSQIPLSVGGWGTRGKSGTERLKAALFHGLGYRVFSKTTGCEAMLIHSVAEGPPSEIFVFRPYGKATIWEQRDLVVLASKLGVDVFLWECMALNPTYVSILQQGWMQDDIATITNAYPDHEDIQGPAGINVAQVISNFIPERSTTVSSEINFHPIMRDVAKQRQCRYHCVPVEQEAWIGQDFLDLFPYQEHPRNIALVADMSEQLHLERDLAILNMAQYVVPDLGVLKTYGDALVCGRQMRFINGCSANERAGFLNNWHATGCDKLDPDAQPDQMIVTLVNNRADRISRSEVFARILVNDAATDKNILVGTNLSGLMNYIEKALEDRLEQVSLLIPNEQDPINRAIERFDRECARFRCPQPQAQSLAKRLQIYASGAGLSIADTSLARLVSLLEEMLSKDLACKSLSDTHKELDRHPNLQRALASLLQSAEPLAPPSAECVETPTGEDVTKHWLAALARSLCLHRLRSTLAGLNLSGKSQASFAQQFKSTYRELFIDGIEVVSRPDAKGDELVLRCAQSVAPGVCVRVLGCQNIKGTGLDFVYRWVAFDACMTQAEKLRSRNAAVRSQAIAALQGFGDHGILDLGTLLSRLKDIRPQSEQEASEFSRLRNKLRRLYLQRRHQLQHSGEQPSAKRTENLLGWLEGWVEFLDGARRYHQAKSLSRDLANLRVSHARAAIEMRELYARAKGGWLAKALLDAQKREEQAEAEAEPID